MGFSLFDFFYFMNFTWIYLGLLWVRLGWFLVLGSGWKCIFNAMVCTNNIITLRISFRKKTNSYLVGCCFINCNFHLKYVWYFSGSVGYFKFCPHICQRSRKRFVYSNIFIYFDILIFVYFFNFSQKQKQ